MTGPLPAVGLCPSCAQVAGGERCTHCGVAVRVGPYRVRQVLGRRGAARTTSPMTPMGPSSSRSCLSPPSPSPRCSRPSTRRLGSCKASRTRASPATWTCCSWGLGDADAALSGAGVHRGHAAGDRAVLPPPHRARGPRAGAAGARHPALPAGPLAPRCFTGTSSQPTSSAGRMARCSSWTSAQAGCEAEPAPPSRTTRPPSRPGASWMPPPTCSRWASPSWRRSRGPPMGVFARPLRRSSSRACAWAPICASCSGG